MWCKKGYYTIPYEGGGVNGECSVRRFGSKNVLVGSHDSLVEEIERQYAFEGGANNESIVGMQLCDNCGMHYIEEQ